MLLVEWTDGRGVSRISNRAHSLDHLWRGRVLSLDNLRFGIEHSTGGYIRPRFGLIRLANEFFENFWLPPETAQLTIKFTQTSEMDAITLLSATAHINQFYTGSVEYRLYATESEVTVNSGQAFVDNLLSVLQWAGDASRLDFTVDSTAAVRASAFAINHTTTADTTILVDLISGMAASGCFAFTLQDGALALIDLLADNGSFKATGYQFLPNTYPYADPISEITGGGETLAGPYSYGQPVSASSLYHTDTANMQAALTDMLTMLQRGSYTLTLFPIERIPAFGEKIYWSSDKPGPKETTTSGWLNVHALTYNFNNRRLIAEGRGGCSA